MSSCWAEKRRRAEDSAVLDPFLGARGYGGPVPLPGECPRPISPSWATSRPIHSFFSLLLVRCTCHHVAHSCEEHAKRTERPDLAFAHLRLVRFSIYNSFRFASCIGIHATTSDDSTVSAGFRACITVAFPFFLSPETRRLLRSAETAVGQQAILTPDTETTLHAGRCQRAMPRSRS